MCVLYSFLLFLTFSVLVANPKKLLYTDHERDWPPCKVVFFGLATNALNVRNNKQQSRSWSAEQGTYSKSSSVDQPGTAANPARGQLNRENEHPLSTFAPENLVSRDGFGSPVPRQPAHLHTQAESGAYLRDPSQVPRRRPFLHSKPPYAIVSVPNLSGHAIASRYDGVHCRESSGTVPVNLKVVPNCLQQTEYLKNYNKCMHS